jgi:hypothetical protein
VSERRHLDELCELVVQYVDASAAPDVGLITSRRRALRVMAGLVPQAVSRGRSVKQLHVGWQRVVGAEGGGEGARLETVLARVHPLGAGLPSSQPPTPLVVWQQAAAQTVTETVTWVLEGEPADTAYAAVIEPSYAAYAQAEGVMRSSSAERPMDPDRLMRSLGAVATAARTLDHAWCDYLGVDRGPA